MPLPVCETILEGSYRIYANRTGSWLDTDENGVTIPNDYTKGSCPFICSEGYDCAPWREGPNFGITNFDNIIFSMLTVFQCITMEGWTDIMYFADDAIGPMFNWIYFILLIVIGSFFMLNLVLGVLSGEFAKERERVENRQKFLLIREAEAEDKAFESYLNWIARGEEISLAEQEEQIRKGGQVGGKYGTTFSKGNVASDGASKGEIYEKKLRIKVRRVVTSQAFYWTVILLVFINTIIKASVHYGMPKWWKEFMEYSDIVFLVLFSGEVLLKIYGLGSGPYFQSTFNKFDVTVIFGSVFEVILSKFRPDISLGISVLRALRLLRIFKITSYWPSLSNLVISLMASLKSIISLIFLLCLFLIVFALLGMQVFGGSFIFEGQDSIPSANFDSFGPAFLTVFQILTGEDWNVVMYNGVRANGGATGGGIVWSIYFILLVFFGNYTLLNVFLAIAVDNLANAQAMTAAQLKEDAANELGSELQKASELNSISPKDPKDTAEKLFTEQQIRQAEIKATKWSARMGEMRQYNERVNGGAGGGKTFGSMTLDEINGVNGVKTPKTAHQVAVMKRLAELENESFGGSESGEYDKFDYRVIFLKCCILV